MVGFNYYREVCFRDDPQRLVEAARLLRISSSPPCLTAKQLTTLANDGFLVVPHFLTPSHAQAARTETLEMRTAGTFFAPPFGGGDWRSDVVHWLGAQAAQPALAAALAEVRALPESMRGFEGFKAAQRGVVPSRPPLGVPRTAQLACYTASPDGTKGGSGGRYRPHRDAPPHPRALLLPGIYMREVTAVLYLSPNEDK